ncbi:MAG TPA: hypothetical protein DIV41_07785, partial [Ruminococcaceae bacterium]|nr:hypothetical protein [Oscillospiraceae bacterium]
MIITSTPRIMHAHEMTPIQFVRMFSSVLPAAELRKSSSGRLPTLGSETEDDASGSEMDELSDDTSLETAEEDVCLTVFFGRLLAFEDGFDVDGGGSE